VPAKQVCSPVGDRCVQIMTYVTRWYWLETNDRRIMQFSP